MIKFGAECFIKEKIKVNVSRSNNVIAEILIFWFGAIAAKYENITNIPPI